MRLNPIPATMRYRFAAILLAALLALCPLAHAESTGDKIVALQTQVQQLLDLVQRLQSTVDSKFGLVQHLVEQSTDNVNQMAATVNAMQRKLSAQTESSGSKLDSVSGQVQSLNDSVDEMKSRLAKLDKQLQDIQAQLQNVQSPPAGDATTASGAQQPSRPRADGAAAADRDAQAPASGQAPPLEDTYQSGLRDYNAAHYDVAAQEFGDVVHYYPTDDLAGNAQFYLGEIDYRRQKYKEAIKSYNAVLEDFSGSPKAPAAQLRKGLALIQLNQKDSGVHELRSLIQRYPQTPEALQARSKLNALGIRINPAPRPAPSQQ